MRPVVKLIIGGLFALAGQWLATRASKKKAAAKKKAKPVTPKPTT